jgi:aconitate hydratase
MTNVDSFGSKGVLNVGGNEYEIFRLNSVEGAKSLPFSLKVLLENLLRTEDGANITADHVRALAQWDANAEPSTEIQFTPARVIMQDFTGVPCIVDLATMREAVAELGGDPKRVNPLAPAEMVIDHSVQIDAFGNAGALERNMESNTSATASGTSSFAGARRRLTTSRLFPRAWVLSTRSTLSIWPAP